MVAVDMDTRLGLATYPKSIEEQFTLAFPTYSSALFGPYHSQICGEGAAYYRPPFTLNKAADRVAMRRLPAPASLVPKHKVVTCR